MTETGRRMGIKLKDPAASGATLKILRQYFPDVPLSEMKDRIVHGEYVFSCDGRIDGRKQLAKLEKAFAQAGISTELYEEWTGGDGAERIAPLSREYLDNSLHRYREIARQVDRDIDNESDE